MARFIQEKKEIMEEMTKDAIIQAAFDILVERSWADFTMERLAKRAGIAKGTVYNYFKNKEDIIHFIILKRTAPMRDKILSLDYEKSDTVDLLSQILDILAKDLFENRLGVSAIVKALGGQSHRSGEEDQILGDIREKFLFTIERGINEGVFKKIDPIIVEEVIHSLFLGMGQKISNGELVGMDKPFLEFLKEVIIAGLTAVRKENDSK